ncbi:MAG: nucleotidyltransferase domain-containing protein [Nanoarchaeota archaeon]|nr:nucleotidyltransferase domain-containing protein [Nanoarchaeota archaeon]MBU1005897.1 nucleotidyltransferase domain-containing protein [Nanoarchaeota archaeon]MBU1946536.1 nucleotidyltransferase domain-containing protein [Nanoarchaeota archaeon]
MKKYKEIKDFIVFGSLVKGKYFPKDVDIALVVNNKNISLIGEIKSQIKGRNIDLEMVTSDDIYQSRLGVNLISEGFSIRDNRFLREKLGLSPMKIYTYGIKNLTQTKKVLFGRGLNNTIKETKSTKLGAGSIMVPIQESSRFEDFLQAWELKYKTKEYLVL